MEIGVSSYSFSRLVREGVLSQLDVIAKAKEMDFDVIEFSTFALPEGETPLSFAPRVKAECDRVGIAVANYTIGADFINGSDGNIEAEIERLKDEVRVAQILGAPGMRHDATRGFAPDHIGAKSFDAALPRLVEGCRAVTEFAAELGIKTMVENHGFFCQDSERVEKLACGVAHPNFGVLIDMGNFCCADEDPAQAVGRLMPYAFHVHAKDFHLKPGVGPFPGDGWFRSRAGNYLRGAIIGHGDVPITQCLRVMKSAGFDGVLSIEFEGIEEPLRGIAWGLANLRRFVAEAYA
ncbi:MAG TPA: sugar phosphate isomerase/epimerase family protein [Candidatus Hydrogenedentes bacterium]|nr:sugar phosphate isomerase/epimerase family protein [Candidatus Hydrogenedentota bacterium]HPG68331.1 sugar phosphate isomerase/epimerase family protein [Candidatus Hydrogenedentota bacterium]